jgi:hypothetical protein
MNILFWQATSFTAVALGFILLSVWWLFFSQVPGDVLKQVQASPRMTTWVAILLGLSGLQFYLGGVWDGSKHIKTGRIVGGADFLWAPHIVIYSSFLIAIALSLFMAWRIVVPAWRAGDRDPRIWFRRDPYMGFVLLVSLYELISVPGDAIWHALYGIDLTAWSPPHILIAAAGSALTISPIGMLMTAYPKGGRPLWVNWISAASLAIALNVFYLVAVSEWEWSGGLLGPLVAARPIWLFPVVGGSCAFFVLMFARQVIKVRWAATLTALFFYLTRFSVMGAMLGLGYRPFSLPMVIIVSALLLDLIPWAAITSPLLRTFGIASVYAVAFVLPTLPLLLRWPTFNGTALAITVVVLVLVGMVLTPVAAAAGKRVLQQAA